MPNQLYLLLSFSISFLVVLFAIPKIIIVAKKKKLFDVPNERTANQQKVIPNLGGIAIFSGFFISAVISLEGFDIKKIISLLLVSLIMFLIGLKDDTIGLTAKKKLFGEILVAIYLVMVSNFRFTNLHGLLGINEINYISSVIISAIAIIGLINAFNLIDGIDGLAAGIGTLISAVYGIIFLHFGQMEYAVLSFSITGSLVAFFFFNVFGKANKIFMGDTGSLTLGVLFAVLTIWFNEIDTANSLGNQQWTLPAISLAIMIIPVIDSIRVFTIRILDHRSPFSPDMNHIHHQLIKITNNHLHATIIMVLGNLLLIYLSLGLIDVLGNNILFLFILTLGFLLAYIPVLLNRNKIAETKVLAPSHEMEMPHLHLIKSINHQTTVAEIENEDDANSNKDQTSSQKLHTS
jgi:UDP-N-acetylmuramyl pentapeptide phosphotransferase/UDP-N-acetylglucosamine-1-phosphate transferase